MAGEMPGIDGHFRAMPTAATMLLPKNTAIPARCPTIMQDVRRANFG
jgi:hypothetical protein